LVAVAPWGVREQLTYEKTALGFYLSGHLIDEVAREVRRFVRTGIAELKDSREPQTVAGIVSDFRVINGQRGRQAIFVLEDGVGRVEATASDALVQQHRDLFKDDELLIATGRLQPGRNGFEARFVVQQAGDLAQARCRFGKYLQVEVGATPPQVGRLMQEYAARKEATEQGDLVHGLRVRLGLRCRSEAGAASAELQLGDAHRMYPSDAALAAWAAEAELGRAVVVYE
jgi:DNA polymerase-3 subunit alpha